MKPAGAYIGFRGGIHWLCEDDYIHELSKFGITKRQFRVHLRDLHVPKVQIGKRWFIERFTYLIALRYLTSFDRPDYSFPGSMSRTHGRVLPDVDIADLRKRIPQLVDELLQAQKLAGVKLSRELKEAVATAAENYQNHLERLEATHASDE